ncbi:MAG: hypothetical protein ACPGWR_19125 [Ardenticatenaceae bacterium]
MSSLILQLLQDSEESFPRRDNSFIIADRLPICFPAAAFFTADDSSARNARSFPIEDAYDLAEQLRWQDVPLPRKSSQPIAQNREQVSLLW